MFLNENTVCSGKHIRGGSEHLWFAVEHTLRSIFSHRFKKRSVISLILTKRHKSKIIVPQYCDFAVRQLCQFVRFHIFEEQTGYRVL